VTNRPSALVDTNVLLDVLTSDPQWEAWSLHVLDAASLIGQVAINDVVYAELSVRISDIELLDAFLDDVGLDVAPIPRAALFVAGKAFGRYRAQGGPRPSMLPDFFIGAHTATLGVPLLTRDARRYRSYFPTLELVTP
jgi:predicted nucleic acid-binding protein